MGTMPIIHLLYFFNPSNGNRSEPYKTTFRSSNVFWENVPAAEMPTYRY